MYGSTRGAAGRCDHHRHRVVGLLGGSMLWLPDPGLHRRRRAAAPACSHREVGFRRSPSLTTSRRCNATGCSPHAPESVAKRAASGNARPGQPEAAGGGCGGCGAESTVRLPWRCSAMSRRSSPRCRPRSSRRRSTRSAAARSHFPPLLSAARPRRSAPLHHGPPRLTRSARSTSVSEHHRRAYWSPHQAPASRSPLTCARQSTTARYFENPQDRQPARAASEWCPVPATRVPSEAGRAKSRAASMPVAEPSAMPCARSAPSNDPRDTRQEPTSGIRHPGSWPNRASTPGSGRPASPVPRAIGLPTGADRLQRSHARSHRPPDRPSSVLISAARMAACEPMGGAASRPNGLGGPC